MWEYVLDLTDVGSNEIEIAVFRYLSRLLRITNFIAVLFSNFITMKHAYVKKFLEFISCFLPELFSLQSHNFCSDFLAAFIRLAKYF